MEPKEQVVKKVMMLSMYDKLEFKLTVNLARRREGLELVQQLLI